jgi:hypothetical protein
MHASRILLSIAKKTFAGQHGGVYEREEIRLRSRGGQDGLKGKMVEAGRATDNMVYAWFHFSDAVRTMSDD